MKLKYKYILQVVDKYVEILQIDNEKVKTIYSEENNEVNMKVAYALMRYLNNIKKDDIIMLR